VFTRKVVKPAQTALLQSLLGQEDSHTGEAFTLCLYANASVQPLVHVYIRAVSSLFIYNNNVVTCDSFTLFCTQNST
jgi:hypothetical protein